MTRDRETTRLVREETSEFWKIPTLDGSFLTREFSPVKFATALQKLQSGKAPRPDQICPEVILHAGPTIKSWLCKFLSSCLCQFKIPKVWRRSLVAAIPKQNKPFSKIWFALFASNLIALHTLQDPLKAYLHPH